MRYIVVVGAIVLLAIVFRSTSLECRPMHVDEAVHAIKFGRLLEKGSYIYDPAEYHGPTLNYFTLVPAFVTGKKTLEQVTVGILRSVPLFFGLALLLLFLLLRPVFDDRMVIFAIIFSAFSAPLVFYSRYYIQEVLFITFAYGLLICLIRYFSAYHKGWIAAAGIFLGLMHATKETDILFLTAMIISAVIVVPVFKPKVRIIKKDMAIMIGCGFVISLLFYSSFFSNWKGVYDSFATYMNYLGRAGHNPYHVHPWYYYLKWLFFFKNNTGPVWSEIPILLLAAAGIYHGRRNPWLVFIACNSIILFAIFTLMPYKTPWNIMISWQGIIIVAAYGGAYLYRYKTGRLVLGLVIAHMLWLSSLTNYIYEADQENPYVYAHTMRDIPEVARSVVECAQHSPEGRAIHVQVFCSRHDYWPLPWYFRKLHAVGWYDHINFKLKPAPIIIISPDQEKDLIHFLYDLPPPGERSLYVPISKKTIMLRHGVELNVYIRSDLYAEL